MTLEEARTNLHIGDLVEIKSTHKGTLTAIYKVMGLEEIEWSVPSITCKLKLVAGSFIDHNGELGKAGITYGPGSIRHMRHRALVKIEDL